LKFPLTFRNSLLSTAVLGKRKPLIRHLPAFCVGESRQSAMRLFRLPSERDASGLIPARPSRRALLKIASIAALSRGLRRNSTPSGARRSKWPLLRRRIAIDSIALGNVEHRPRQSQLRLCTRNSRVSTAAAQRVVPLLHRIARAVAFTVCPDQRTS
jgi:hypothetical protein